MKLTLFSDTHYRHHWKLMTLLTGAVFAALIVAFTQGWILFAVALALGFGILLLQWLTIDPPNVTDEDVFGASGRGAKPRRKSD